MSIQYHMRAWNGSTYVNWVVNDFPDLDGSLYPNGSSGLTNVTINKVVNSKMLNYIKPLNSANGTIFHINSYDWLKSTRTSSDDDSATDPIAIPTKNSGLAIVRGTADGYTPREYASIYWNENQNTFIVGFTSNEVQTFSKTKPLITGHLSIIEGDEDGYLSIRTASKTAATSGIIRLPNAESLLARNFANSNNINLIGTDSSDRITIGSGSDITYLSGNLKLDGYLNNGTNPATSGFVRVPNNTTIVSARNNINSNNLTILSTDSSNVIYVGDTNNTDIRYNTSGQHEFEVNGSFLLRLGNPSNGYLSFDSAILSPAISQDSTSSGNGKNLTIAAQTSTALTSFGGGMIINSGIGTSADGYVDIRTGNSVKVRVFGNTAPTVSDLTLNSSENANSFILFNDNLRFYDFGSGTVTINHDTTSRNTGNNMIIAGQDAAVTGGNLSLRSGSGSINSGYVSLMSGLTNTEIRLSDQDGYAFISMDGYETFRSTLEKNILHNGLRQDIDIVTTTKIISDADGYNNVLVNSASGGGFTVSLPATPTHGDVYTFKDSGSAAANNWTLSGNGHNIDGSASISITSNYTNVTVMYVADVFNAWFRI